MNRTAAGTVGRAATTGVQPVRSGKGSGDDGHDRLAHARDALEAAVEALDATTPLDGGALLTCVRHYEQLILAAEHLVWPAWLPIVRGSADAGARRRYLAAVQARAEAMAVAVRAERRMARLPPRAVAEACRARPGLAGVERLIARIRGRHPAGAVDDVDAALALLDQTVITPTQMWTTVVNNDIRFEGDPDSGRPDTFASLSRRIQSPDRDVRRTAHGQLVQGLARHGHTLAAVLASGVQRNVALARIRGFPSALAAHLAGDALTESSVHHVLDQALGTSGPLRDLLRAKAGLVGRARLAPYDFAVTPDDLRRPELTPESMWDWLEAVLGTLGGTYLDLLHTAREEGWVVWQSARRAGPRRGYTRSCPGLPPVVVVREDDGWDGLFALAHELGHAFHHVLSGRRQRPGYARVSRAVAEVPALLHELLLARHMIRSCGQQQAGRYALSYLLSCLQQNFYSAAAMCRFQIDLHEAAEQRRPLTLRSICDTYAARMAELYGDSVEVGPDDLGLMWARSVQHVTGIRSYEYVLGTWAAVLIVEGLPTDPSKRQTSGLLRLLAAGSSSDPHELLRACGVDLTSPAADGAVSRFFTAYLDQWKRWAGAQRVAEEVVTRGESLAGTAGGQRADEVRTNEVSAHL